MRYGSRRAIGKAGMMLGFLAAVLTAVTPAAAGDCSTEVRTVVPGRLTIAAYDYAPFAIVAQDGSVTGIDADIARAAALDHCLEPVFAIMDPAATIQSVVTGRADLAIGSWNRTSKRLQIVDVSAPIYLDHMGILSRDGTSSIAALQGKRVGTVTGYHWVSDMQKVFGRDLKLYPDPVSMAQDLLAGRLDAAANGYNYAIHAQKTAGAYQGLQINVAQPDPRIAASRTPPQVGMLYTKGNQTLGDALDATITRLRDQGAIAKALSDAGLDPANADVGAPRLID